MTDVKSQHATRLPSPTRRNWVWFTIQFVLRIAFSLGLRYRADGVKHIPEEGGGLVVVNHQSFLDPLLVGLPLQRPVSYLARDSLFRVPIIGWILRNTYVLPINREAASSTSIKAAVESMRHGFLVGIFPEGTRTRDGRIAEFKPGFVALIRRAQRPVYPVGLAGAGQAMPRNAWFPRLRPVRVVFGTPITEDELAPYTARGNEEALIQLVRDRVVECQHAAQQWLDGTRGRPDGAAPRPGPAGSPKPEANPPSHSALPSSPAATGRKDG